jgi:XapX domain-containing protein
MKDYVLSLAAGGVVGILYGLLAVDAPAPPVVALIGLAGILLGEQILPVGRRVLGGIGFGEACAAAGTTLHLFGALPGRPARRMTRPVAPTLESLP